MKKTAILFIALAVCSALLIVWQHYGMGKSRVLLDGPATQVSAITDVVNGGNTTAEIDRRDDYIALSCNIIATTRTHPFCGMTLAIEDISPFDASSYQSLVLELEFISDVKDTLLVYLMNDEEQITGQRRANMFPVNVINGRTKFELPLDSFFVPSWWMYQHSDDPLRGLANLQSVSALRLTSGDNTNSRHLTLRLKKAELRGKYISKPLLYLGIIVLWVGLVVAVSSATLLSLHRQKRQETIKKNKLYQLNSHLASIQQKLHHQTITDPLTDALNRRGMDEVFAMLASSPRAPVMPISLVYFDIDHFKAINDQFGHEEGDKVLIKLTQLVFAIIKKSDSLVRLGGEEFLIICPETTLSEASEMAERCRQKIMSATLGQHNITCSFGVIEATGNSLRKGVEVADRHLYQAKSQGRNKVVCSPPD